MYEEPHVTPRPRVRASTPRDSSPWTQSVSVCRQRYQHHCTKWGTSPGLAVEPHTHVQQSAPLLNGPERAHRLLVDAVVA